MSTSTTAEPDPRSAGLLAAVRRRTEEIVDALTARDEASLLAPSALPGWSRLTIACHLRFGARAFARLSRAASAGLPASYYPEGRERQRPATLRPEPGEAPAEVVASLAAAGADLHRCWSRLGPAEWRCEVREPAGRADLGPLPLSALPLLRLTEVEVHGTDLDLGLEDWSAEFVRAALPFRVGWLSTRRSNHRSFDATLTGSWLLAADDGPGYLITVDDHGVASGPVETDGDGTADAVIEGSSRDLLALLLGRPARRPLRTSGDRHLAAAFGAAFPGP